MRPYPYQQEMLEQLDVERVVHDRHRNLVVAATGTGKTVVAALDYRALCRPRRGQPSACCSSPTARRFLEQSLRTYREVLADAAPSASCTSAAPARSAGGTSSPPSSH